MEKISRILAPSARTQSYDASRAQPVRPGAPEMGRPETSGLVVDKFVLSDNLSKPPVLGQAASKDKSEPQTYGPKETIKTQLIKEMTDRFFLKQNPKEVAGESGQSSSEEIANRVQTSSGSRVNPESSSDISL
jgi:hypothetical protein